MGIVARVLRKGADFRLRIRSVAYTGVLIYLLDVFEKTRLLNQRMNYDYSAEHASN